MWKKISDRSYSAFTVSNLYYNERLDKYAFYYDGTYYIAPLPYPTLHIDGNPCVHNEWSFLNFDITWGQRISNRKEWYYCPILDMYIWYLDAGRNYNSTDWLVTKWVISKTLGSGVFWKYVETYDPPDPVVNCTDISQRDEWWATSGGVIETYWDYGYKYFNPPPVPQNPKVVTASVVGGESSPTFTGEYSGGTVIGWKQLSSTGSGAFSSFREYNEKYNGEYLFKVPVSGTFNLWFDGVEYIISQAINNKSSFYWHSSTLIGTYTYELNGTNYIGYSDADVQFDSYVNDNQTVEEFIAQVNIKGFSRY